jgi:PAS domain S-box-containing protein
MASALSLFDQTRIARPGLCQILPPEVLALHIVSDLAIGLAYFSIPAAIAVFVMRRRDLVFSWVFWLFAAFIIACGTTHFVHVWGLFSPDWWREGIVKAVCAVISVVTAVALWPLLPRALALPSPAALRREVEERRAAEARALRSEARMSAFIANLPEALFVLRTAPGGNFRYEAVNPAFERLFGLSRAQAEGGNPEALLPPAIAQAVLPRWRQCAAEGRRLDYAAEAETPNGFRAWQTVLVPMQGADGQVDQLLGTARDVTETRRLQLGLVQNARLATVGTMCAGLAHEMSQPLNIATLWLRRAQSGAAERLPQAIAVVEGQLRRIADLVARIRALASAEDAAPVRFDAAPVVAAAVGTMARQAVDEDVEVTLEPAPAPLPVRGQPARLEEALLHLLANAREACAARRAADPSAPARITVRLLPDSRTGEAVVEVQDTGPGIPDALAERIFDPFFTTKEPGTGVGLGLTFALGVAHAMGGRIEAHNPVEGGACLRLILRLDQDPQAAAEAQRG